MFREKEDNVNLDLACEAVLDRASEHNLVALLDKWSMCWKQRGRTQAIGPHASEKYSTLGFYGHGGVFGISKASEMKRACMAVNHFLRAFHPRHGLQSLCCTIRLGPSRCAEHDWTCYHAVVGNFWKDEFGLKMKTGKQRLC